VAEDRLAILPAERALAVEPKYTAEEVGRRAKVDVEVLLEQRRAAGLPVAPPGERAFSKRDVAAARRLAQALEAGLPREALIEGARVFGRVANQAAAAARSLAGDAFIQPGDTERDAGLRLAEVARTIHPQTADALLYLYEEHMRELLRNDVIAASDLAAGRVAGTARVSVCFADLVGFTRLGEELAPEELGTVATRLSVLAADVTQEPVSLVKIIGDAVMFVSPKPEPLLDTALKLIDATEEEGRDFPLLKAGVASGEALNRWGDWYGSPVNLASRVTAVAYPTSVLATKEVRDNAAASFAWSAVGRKRLKGIEQDVALYRCRRLEPVE
jgi:adenylate cyclase